MILPEHLEHHRRIRKHARGRMLMLGNQENKTGIEAKELFGISEYSTLDPDGGDLTLDLGNPIALDQAYDTVFNLGTIEHVWDVHTAWSNAARMVKVDGHFLNHSPVAGYRDHGIHVTEEAFIRQFFLINGFFIADAWTTDSARGRLAWMVARKVEHTTEFQKPQQTFKHGRKTI